MINFEVIALNKCLSSQTICQETYSLDAFQISHPILYGNFLKPWQ